MNESQNQKMVSAFFIAIKSWSAPGGLLGLIFAGYVPRGSQSPYPIIVYSVANYRPHLSQFWENM